jgi:hypothetical protein
MPAIPPTILEMMIAFCTRQATGQILLHVHQGRISSYAITETGKIDPMLNAEKIQKNCREWPLKAFDYTVQEE